MKAIILIILFLTLGACGTFQFVPSDKEHSVNSNTRKSVIFDDDGNIIVKSGSCRDNRRGYYYDKKEKRCIEVFYSSGADCIPPPYKTLNECLSCKGR